MLLVIQIEEFVDCRDQLSHSFNFIHTLTEMNVLDMITSVNRCVLSVHGCQVCIGSVSMSS